MDNLLVVFDMLKIGMGNCLDIKAGVKIGRYFSPPEQESRRRLVLCLS